MSQDKCGEISSYREAEFPIQYTSEQVELIKKMYAIGASDAELSLLLYTARKLNLDVLTRQLHMVVRERWNPALRKTEHVASIQIGIDGYVELAQRVKDQNGRVLLDGYESKAIVEGGKVVGARAKVWRKDFAHPIEVEIDFAEYVPMKDGRPMAVWATKPKIMIEKCALALALRRTFPQRFSGTYVPEEMDTVGEPVTEVKHGEYPSTPEEERVNYKPPLVMPPPKLAEPSSSEYAHAETVNPYPPVEEDVTVYPKPDLEQSLNLTGQKGLPGEATPTPQIPGSGKQAGGGGENKLARFTKPSATYHTYINGQKQTFGPYKKEDIANLPPSALKFFIEGGSAVAVDISGEKPPSFPPVKIEPPQTSGVTVEQVADDEWVFRPEKPIPDGKPKGWVLSQLQNLTEKHSELMYLVEPPGGKVIEAVRLSSMGGGLDSKVQREVKRWLGWASTASEKTEEQKQFDG